jgi:threonine synthase
MGEGNTPFVQSASIGPRLGLRLTFKLEMCNPSGSYKDRFAAAQVTEFLRSGVKGCIATSSGNTGSALAAFSARYGIMCTLFVNETAPAGKLHQMQGHGAHLFRVKGFSTSPEITECVFQQLQRLAAENSFPLVVSAYRYCPQGMRGVESIATELAQQCADGIDHVFVPVGGGGLFTAVCRGFRTLGLGTRIHAVQPEGCATLVSAYEEGREDIRPVISTTQVSGLAVPFDIDAGIALAELRRSGGRGISIADEEVFAAQQQMLREEGIWPEPAGAAALAGCLSAQKRGWIASGETVVCLVTGHGFKTADSVAGSTHYKIPPLIEHSEISSRLFKINV